MRILSHRGYWKTAVEKNSPVALERSFSCGFGTETDIRDCLGELVISHDPPHQGALRAAELFELHRRLGPSLPLALNIKADGLQAMLLDLLTTYDVQDFFVFDMAIPDAAGYLRHGIRFFTRQSEWEPDPPCYAAAAGVWLDAFQSEWYDTDTIVRHLDHGKQVCVVSPDLHGREHRGLWDRLAASSIAKHPDLMLCTDFPEDARDAFHA